jgi:Cof subfamily protein (haloacid dehalogenase superfamily)
MNREFHWFITDVDGTLLDEDNTLPEANRRALQRCRELGVPVVLATGRRWTTLARLLDRLQIGDLVDFAVLNNGMIVKELKTRTALHREAFSLEILLAVVESLAALSWEPIVLTYNSHDAHDVFYRKLSLMNGDFVAKNLEFSRALEDYRELEDVSVVELILLGPEVELTLAQQALEGLPLETALIRNTFYAGFMLEITPRNISKLSGARHVARLLDLSLDQAVAIGDSANDLPLLRQVGKAVAMAHAPEGVRLAAHEISTVAETVLRYFPVPVQGDLHPSP